MQTVLVTGAAGYIGSHAVKRMLGAGRRVVAVDDLSAGHRGAIDRLMGIAGGRLAFVHAGVGDRAAMERALAEHDVGEVVHFAASALVGESVHNPLKYYLNNTAATAQLLAAIDASGSVRRFVFSSTCATYGEPSEDRVPIREDCPQSPINPYGRSKLASEMLIRDWAAARSGGGQPVGVAMLRYFNVAGSDRAGLLGEDHDPETHIIPVVLGVALGLRERVTIFGTDYPTRDGTCLRDYIHVEDLVDAHAAVLGALRDGEVRVYNLGIGRAVSVREIVEAARRVTGHAIPASEGPRREGDPPVLLADASRIAGEIGWRASITDVEEMVASAWRWFRANPQGYRDGRAG